MADADYIAVSREEILDMKKTLEEAYAILLDARNDLTHAINWSSVNYDGDFTPQENLRAINKILVSVKKKLDFLV